MILLKHIGSIEDILCMWENEIVIYAKIHTLNENVRYIEYVGSVVPPQLGLMFILHIYTLC